MQRQFKEGDHAPHAHQDLRKFPEWYKPYGFNYHSDGYLLLGLFGIALFGYSYLRDINEFKGRKQRKVFTSKHLTRKEKCALTPHSVARIEAGDESYSKFLKPKQRADPHHYSHWAQQFYPKHIRDKLGHGHH